MSLLWGVWGRKEGEGKKSPSQVWLAEPRLEFWGMDRETRRRFAVPAHPSAALGFFCTSVCSSPTPRAQLEESHLPVTAGAQQRTQSPERWFSELAGQHSLQSWRDLSPKGSWQSSSLPISFGDLALLSMKKQRVTGSFLIFFFSPVPSNDPAPKCYFPLMDCVLKECQNAEVLSLKY